MVLWIATYWGRRRRFPQNFFFFFFHIYIYIYIYLIIPPRSVFYKRFNIWGLESLDDGITHSTYFIIFISYKLTFKNNYIIYTKINCLWINNIVFVMQRYAAWQHSYLCYGTELRQTKIRILNFIIARSRENSAREASFQTVNGAYKWKIRRVCALYSNLFSKLRIPSLQMQLYKSSISQALPSSSLRN